MTLPTTKELVQIPRIGSATRRTGYLKGGVARELLIYKGELSAAAKALAKYRAENQICGQCSPVPVPQVREMGDAVEFCTRIRCS